MDTYETRVRRNIGSAMVSNKVAEKVMDTPGAAGIHPHVDMFV